MHTHTHTYIHTHTHTYIHACMHTYTHTHKHTHIHTQTHKQTHIPTYIHTYIHTYIRTYTHTYVLHPPYTHTGTSIMSAIGGALFIARSLEDYSDMAHAWAKPLNRKRLHDLRTDINATLRGAESPLSASEYTKRLEGIYTLAWETFKARRQPKGA